MIKIVQRFKQLVVPAVLLLNIVVLSGCYFLGNWKPYLTLAQHKVPLIPAEAYPSDYAGVYRVVYQDSSLSFPLLVQSEVQGSRLTFAGISEFGLRLFLVHYDGVHLEVEAPWANKLPFNPVELLIYVQFALLDEMAPAETYLSNVRVKVLDNTSEARETLVYLGNMKRPVISISSTESKGENGLRKSTKVENLSSGRSVLVQR